MSDNTGQVDERDPVTLETARVGYQVAVDLWTFQSSLNWSRFNAMLTANSIIIAVIGIALYNQASPAILRRGFPIVGLILCILWLFLMVRGRDHHRYWISQARELEEKYLSPVVNVVSGADPKGGKIRFSWLSRVPPFGTSQDWVIYGVIAAFAGVYVIALRQLWS